MCVYCGLLLDVAKRLELIAETDYPSFDVDGACQAFYEWKQHKVDDIMGFRNNSYRSVITGTVAPVHHTLWKDALDDSLEAYLQIGKEEQTESEKVEVTA